MPSKKEWSNDGQDPTTGQLRDTLSELAQISELEELEVGYAPKLVNIVKFLLSDINQSITLNQEVVMQHFHDVKDAYLMSDAVIVMTDADGNMLSKPLLQFSPENILSIVQNCTPDIRRLAEEKRKLVGTRVQAAEKLLSEFNKGKTTVKSSRPELTESDIVESSISSEQ